MKAAKRIHAYVQSLQNGRDADSPYFKMSGLQELITDLEAVLDSRESWRQAARTQTEQMLRDLHAALWPDKPVHLHSFEHILTTIRNRRAAPFAAFTQERAERARLATQLAAAEQKVADITEQLQTVKESESLELASTQSRYRILRTALREVCEAVLPLYKDRDPGQQLAALQAQLEQRADLQAQLDRLTGSALHEQVRDLQRMLRKQRDAAQELRELRNKLTDLVGVGTGDFTDWSNE